MSTKLVMPKLGLTMTEGVLLEWKVAPGDRFSKGDILFVVETDKAANDIEAEEDGYLAERLAEEGDTVPVGEPVGRLSDTEQAAHGPDARGNSEVVATPYDAVDAPGELLAPSSNSAGNPSGKRIISTPLARRIAKSEGIDLGALQGSGPNGRIKALDVKRAISAATAAQPSVLPAGQQEAPADAPLLETSRTKPTAVRASMARGLATVKHGVPHFYLSTEVEVSALLDLRAELNLTAEFPKLTLTPFILASVGRCLLDFPNINRIWDNGEIVTFGATSVSVAVDTENGLYVPVVPNCGTSSLDKIAKSARAAAEKAKRARLSTSEMSGSAITVSNAGMHDVTWMTSIISPGQSSIIGVGSVREIFRPDADGRPALKREMGLVFSGDHRVHTGVEGLRFLNAVKSNLENPMRLLRHR